MSSLKKIKRYSVFYFVASLGLSLNLKAAVFNKNVLQNMAVSYIETKIYNIDHQTMQLNALTLDSRIPDRDCNTALDLSTPNAPPFNRQVTVQIKCDDDQSWIQYVHVRILEMAPVVIVNTNVARGEIIKGSQLSIEMKPTHFIRTQYLDNPKALIGSRSKRNIQSGMPISLNQICMVCKGDPVNIYANLRGLKIKTSGIALEDGTLGEQIQVENKKTGKVLNARVNGVESVQVNI